jgi:hypothetical protein
MKTVFLILGSILLAQSFVTISDASPRNRLRPIQKESYYYHPDYNFERSGQRTTRGLDNLHGMGTLHLSL